VWTAPLGFGSPEHGDDDGCDIYPLAEEVWPLEDQFGSPEDQFGSPEDQAFGEPQSPVGDFPAHPAASQSGLYTRRESRFTLTEADESIPAWSRRGSSIVIEAGAGLVSRRASMVSVEAGGPLPEASIAARSIQLEALESATPDLDFDPDP
jgi:hypothetical protein